MADHKRRLAWQLSHFAWAALDQLKGGDVWDGNLVSKSGRTELVEGGYAERKGRGMNGLTSAGKQLAIRMSPEGWHTGRRN